MNSKRKKLTSSEIGKKLSKISEWTVNQKETELSKTFIVTDFINGLAFVAKIAVHAEVMNHHPDIELSYGKVRVTLSTHDADGLTISDFDLAKKIDGLKS